jgi:hypothetical protein
MDSSMRILTVRQPWAWAIIHGGKDVENRGRSLGPYRGPVAIHAGKSDDLAAFETVAQLIGDRFAEFTPDRGSIIGVVDLVDVHRSGPFEGECYRERGVTDWCSQWAQMGAHHLQLANPRALDEPLPWKGGLGLRKSPLDIAGGWLVQDTGVCTCGPGPVVGAVYGHESGCGYEPVARLGDAT